MSQEPFYNRAFVPRWVVALIVIAAILGFISYGTSAEPWQLGLGALVGVICLAAFTFELTETAAVIRPVFDQPQVQPAPSPTLSEEDRSLLEQARKIMQSLNETNPKRLLDRVRELRDAAKDKPVRVEVDKGGPKKSDLVAQVRALKEAAEKHPGLLAEAERLRGVAVKRADAADAKLAEERGLWTKEKDRLVAEAKEAAETVATLRQDLQRAQDELVTVRVPLLAEIERLGADLERLRVEAHTILTWGAFTDAWIASLQQREVDADARVEEARLLLEDANTLLERVRANLQAAREDVARHVQERKEEAERHVRALADKDSAHAGELVLVTKRAEVAEANLRTTTQLQQAASLQVTDLTGKLKTSTGELEEARRQVVALEGQLRSAKAAGGNRGQMRHIPTVKPAACVQCGVHTLRITGLESDLGRARQDLAAANGHLAVFGEHLIPLVFPAVLRQLLADIRAEDANAPLEPEDDLAAPPVEEFRRGFGLNESPAE